MVATEVLVSIVALLVAVYFFATKRPNNFPPGPRGLPFLGNLAQVTRPPYNYFIKLQETYGDIIGLYLGANPTVILNNYKHIKEAFSNNAFSGRPQSQIVFQRCLDGNRGVLFSQGHAWSEQRRFALKTLRDFGFGKKSIEQGILDEVNELIEAFRKECGQPISSQNRFNLAVLNVLWAMLAGERFSHDDPRLKNLIKVLTDAVRENPIQGQNPLQENVPLIKWFCDNFYPSDQSFRNAFIKGTYGLIDEVIKQHAATLQEDSPRDFIDVYLNEIAKTTDRNSTFFKEEGYLQLKVLMLDMFAAGAETTSTTLTYSFLYMALHPDKQKKMFEEMNKVVGNSRNVSLLDRPEMPYTEACIMEIQRFASLVPLVPHHTHEDVQFQGHTIPKGTTVIANLYAASRDPKAWGDPENFRPERFLSPDGKATVRNEAFMPFSSGKRVCLGESLAKDELFLFLSNLFQAFQVKCVDGEPKPTTETYFSIVLVPKPHRIVLIDRQA